MTAPHPKFPLCPLCLCGEKTLSDISAQRDEAPSLMLRSPGVGLKTLRPLVNHHSSHPRRRGQSPSLKLRGGI